MSKNQSKNSKNCQKISPKFKKCKKLQNCLSLPGKQKSVPPSHMVRFYHRLTSTKSVLRQASTRLNRADFLEWFFDNFSFYFFRFFFGVIFWQFFFLFFSGFFGVIFCKFLFIFFLSVGALRAPPSFLPQLWNLREPAAAINTI